MKNILANFSSENFTYLEIEMSSKCQKYANNWKKESCGHPGNCVTIKLVELHPTQNHYLNQKQKNTFKKKIRNKDLWT